MKIVNLLKIDINMKIFFSSKDGISFVIISKNIDVILIKN